MKNVINFKVLIALGLLVSTTSYSDQISIRPQTIRVVPINTFLPAGFDDNDNVQVVVSGDLPNTCYKAGMASVQVDQDEKKVYVQTTAYVYPGCWCAQVLVPYTHTMNIGILPKGQYQVLIRDEKDRLHDRGNLNIAASKTAHPDDYLYAPVQDVLVSTHSLSGQSSLTIRGTFTSSCMHFKETKVFYRSPQVIEVLPIADFDEGRECQSGSFPFEEEVKLQSPWKGNTLIYVRSLNGQSVSKVVEF